MAGDIEGLEERLELLTSFDSVVSVFSTPLEIDEEHIQKDLVGLLSSEAVLKRVARDVWVQLAAQPGPWGGNEVRVFLAGLEPVEAINTYPPISWGNWGDEPKAVLHRVKDVAGHKIGDDSWYTAIVDWILVGRALVPNSGTTPLAPQVVSVPRWIACQWRTKLLFSGRPEEPPTLLQYWPPQSLDPSERDEWQPLVRKAAPQITDLQFSDMASTPLGMALLLAGLLWVFTKAKQDKPEIDEPE
jgi:hypothetical protein